MYFKHIYSFFLICFVLAATDLSAQTISLENLSQVKVSSLSDQQILEVWQKIQTSGYSESEVYKGLIQKGMPSTEIEALKSRINIIKSGAVNLNSPKSVIKIDSVKYTRDSVMAISPPPLKKHSLIYGYDFFANSDLKFEPDNRIPTPSNYILGPEDQLIINVSGINERTITGKISPDGNLHIINVGLIYLNGFTIDQAFSQIRSKLLKIYPALATGQTKLTVNLGNMRSIRIMVWGEVTKPGPYTISSLSSFSNALYLTGGPSIQGSLRNIQIIRANKVIRTVDFYPFIQKGLLNDNIRLEDQDVIYFPVYTKRVSIDGEVKRPGLYELLPTETLQDLIQYAGGFSDIAYKATAKIVQIGDKERSVKNVPSNIFDGYVPKNADNISFEAISNRYSNRIILQGAVSRPGIFELTPGLTLRQLIQQADGLRDDASLSNVQIKRTKPDLEKELISFNLGGTIPDIPLMNEDSVMVFSNKDLKDELSVVIDGFVRSPGKFTYRKGMKISDAIAMAGGLSNDAASDRVEISRLVKNRADTIANQLTTVIKVNLDPNFPNNNESTLLEPLDYIYVPRLVNYHSLGNVTIKGEILFPGDYVLQRRDESALELIKRAGGLTPSGSLANTQIHRNGLRVEMDFTGKKTSLSTKGLILKPGDSILVPHEDPFVEVSGAVNSPQLIEYNGRNFKYYINAAGGSKENARLKGAYIKYANGTNKAVDRFLFFRIYPKAEPGSKIIVPVKTDLPHISIAEIGAITSVLTALISLIVILKL